MINLLKYLLFVKDKYNFNYKMINMEELPEFSPYIQSEILFRTIISSLKQNSKLSFLFLQLNSGGGTDIISTKTWYKIKMIPLVLIQKHILNDFNPYFFTYYSSDTANLAFNEIQTHLKSYNEFYIRRNDENVSINKSDLNTVKILYLKFHEYGHSKYRGGFKMNLSPQFLLKNNLSVLNNDISISKGILENKIKYLNKNLTKFLLPKYNISNDEKDEKDKKIENTGKENKINEEKDKVNEEDNEEEGYYIEHIYQSDEDEDDLIEGKDTENQFGESGFAIEYFLCGNYLCSNGIVRYQGNLNKLLDPQLYIGESLVDLKKIIVNKLKIAYNREPSNIIKSAPSLNNINFKNIKKDPYEMYSYSDFGILVNE